MRGKITLTLYVLPSVCSFDAYLKTKNTHLLSPRTRKTDGTRMEKKREGKWLIYFHKKGRIRKH